MTLITMNKPSTDKWIPAYESSINSFAFSRGIRALESARRRQRSLEANDDYLTKLALLYDHEATRHHGAKRKRYEARALSLCRRALKANPNSYKGFWGIGRVLWHRRDKRALIYARKAYKARKRTTGTAGMYGQHVALIYESIKKYKLAERWYLKGITENPHDFGTYLNLTVFYLARGKRAEAVRFVKVLEDRLRREPARFRKTRWGRRIARFIASTKRAPTRARRSAATRG